MEPKVSPPETGGVARTDASPVAPGWSGLPKRTPIWTTPSAAKPTMSVRPQPPLLYQEGKPSVPFLKIWRYGTLGAKPLHRKEGTLPPPNSLSGGGETFGCIKEKSVPRAADVFHPGFVYLPLRSIKSERMRPPALRARRSR
jgi:hypothetical protein